MTIYAMEDDDGTLLVGPDKTNGAITTAASRLSIKPILKFEPTLEHDGTVPLMQFDGLSDLRIREHVEAAAAQTEAAARGDSSDTVAWLVFELADGPRWSTDVQAAAKRDGISDYKLRTAKQKLNVESTREGGTGQWFMRLPQHSGQVPGAQMSNSTPISSRIDISTSGQNHMSISTCKESSCRSERYMETPSTSEICDCGAQLISPASIRYGKCQECRLSPSKDDGDDEPPS
jgi:hypothetical protein